MVTSTCSVCGRKFTADPWKENIYICPACAVESPPLAAPVEPTPNPVSDPLSPEPHPTGWSFKAPEPRRHSSTSSRQPTRSVKKPQTVAEVAVVTEEVPIDQIPPEVAAALGIADAVTDTSTPKASESSVNDSNKASPSKELKPASGRTVFSNICLLWGALAFGCIPLAMAIPEWNKLLWIAAVVFAMLWILFVLIAKRGEKTDDTEMNAIPPINERTTREVVDEEWENKKADDEKKDDTPPAGGSAEGGVVDEEWENK